MKKIKVKMNKRIYLGFSILEISKTLMYGIWYDYMKPKYNKIQNCVIQTLKIFTKIFLMVSIKDLTSQIILLILRDLYPLVKMKNTRIYER